MPAHESVAQQLCAMLDPLQQNFKNSRSRAVPSAFNSGDDMLRAFPLPSEWRWHTLEAHLMRMMPETLIVQLPSFWQIEPFTHTAARAATVPVCIVEPQNYPLDKAAIRYAAAQGVLAEAAEAAAIADYLHIQQTALPQYWLLVHAVDAPQFSIPPLLARKNIAVAQEVHLVPGVPLLVQCEHAAAAKQQQFHQSELFEWRAGDAAAQVSSKSLPFPLAPITLPFALTDTGQCACGKRLYIRQ